MLRIAICDDSRTDRDRVYRSVTEYTRDRGMIAEVRVYEHPDAMISDCERFRPHIYLLDIMMPMVTGIQTARELRWDQPDAQIVFITAEASYALESFDVNPVSYLLKPVDRHKLFGILDIAVRRADADEEKCIPVKVRGGFSTVAIDEILYLDYRNHVVTYHMRDGEVISTTTMRIGFAEYLEKNHADRRIVQCHESIAVSIAAIEKLTRTELSVRGGERLPVSKSRYPFIADAYMDLRLGE